MTALYKGGEVHILAYDFNIAEVKRILQKRKQIVERQKIKELNEARKLFLAQGFLVDAFLKVREG